jgi:phosphoribosylanthranilate isomerase
MTVSRTRVKVCGLTRAIDARAAARAGADALGVILAPGHRRSLTLDEAAAVLAEVPPEVTRTGVFVDAAFEDVVEAVARLGLSEVQLHGSEDPAYCAAAPAVVVKTFRIGAGVDAQSIERYRGAVAAVLLDTLVEGAPGGSGVVFDWELARGIPDVAPVYLAGGLDPNNVGEAVRRVRPAGVDVSSGVEEAPGIKNEVKMVRFVSAVRAADRACEEVPAR